MKINNLRLKEDIETLSLIGKTKGGITRLAFSNEDITARNWFISKLKESGLDVLIDQAGNIRGRLTTKNANKPIVACGSHLDTVKCGGHLDGALGVLAGLEALRSLKESGEELSHPVEVINFSDEEGRFGGMLGSRALAGALTQNQIDTASDVDGVSLHDCLIKNDLDPQKVLEAKEDPKNFKAFVELHIEQGPVLERTEKTIGVVEAITGLFKWEISIKGQANHAGTTPMNMRRDAFQGLATFAVKIEDILKEHGSPNTRTTIGKVKLFPGSPNVVPGKCVFTLEVRDTDPELLEELKAIYQNAIKEITKAKDLSFEIVPLSNIEPVLCDKDIVNLISSITQKEGIDYTKMPSGAAHDAQYMASITKTGMIFIPSINGISHSPLENSAWDDIEKGTKILTKTLYELAR